MNKPTKERTRYRILMTVTSVVFAITFTLGIFGNPNFNIHDFFMNLSSDILGLVITVVLVDRMIDAKLKK